MKAPARKRKALLWEKAQLEKKRKKAVKVSLLFLLFLFTALTVTVIRVGVKNLTTPLEKKECWTRKTNISQANRVNIVFDNELLAVFSLDKREKKASILVIPEDFYLKEGGEVYRLGSFFELGEIRDGCGGRFLRQRLEDFLAVPIDRYVKIPNTKYHPEPERSSVQGSPESELCSSSGQIPNIAEVRDFIKETQGLRWFLRFLLNFKAVKKSLETDLSFFEIFKLWWQIKDLRFDKISFDSLKKGELTLDYELLDGTKAEVVDSNLLHEEISSLFRDSQIEEEKIKVEVLNTTLKQGLGQKAGLLITHMGADLVHVGNWPETLEKTQIWLIKKEDRRSSTLKRIAEVFEAEVFMKPEVEEARGDLLILLGEDDQRY